MDPNTQLSVFHDRSAVYTVRSAEVSKTILVRKHVKPGRSLADEPGNFGESGKNFIEIGKRPKVQATMLRLAVPLRQTEFSSVG